MCNRYLLWKCETGVLFGNPACGFILEFGLVQGDASAEPGDQNRGGVVSSPLLSRARSYASRISDVLMVFRYSVTGGSRSFSISWCTALRARRTSLFSSLVPFLVIAPTPGRVSPAWRADSPCLCYVVIRQPHELGTRWICEWRQNGPKNLG